jgi:hypothetical protein
MLQVFKEWAAAVGSMRPLLAELPDGTSASDSRLWHFCMSQLARHVGIAAMYENPLSAWALHTFSVRMPNLEELHCSLEDFWSSLVFPARLVALDVNFITLSGPDKFAAIAAIATLPRLEKLSLASNNARSCNLSALVRAPALHTLELQLKSHVLESPANIEALRNMPHLRSLNFRPSPADFTRVLQPPHSLKLETLDVHGPFTSEHGASIVHLSSLTDLSFTLDSLHTDFLRELPSLRHLEMRDSWCTVQPNTDRIMHSLHALVNLTKLSLYGSAIFGHFALRYTTDHLAACLPHMPLLTTLYLANPQALDSLRFLSAGPITRSLRKLALSHFRSPLPLRELAHVHALSSLTELMLFSVFDRPLDEYTRSLYTPPSLLLPSLLKFID